MKSFHVRLVDDNIAAIYESSRFATSDLKEHAPLVRRAVALGRTCIEPLTVLCTLMASSPAELLALQLHPLQVRMERACTQCSVMLCRSGNACMLITSLLHESSDSRLGRPARPWSDFAPHFRRQPAVDACEVHRLYRSTGAGVFLSCVGLNAGPVG